MGKHGKHAGFIKPTNKYLIKEPVNCGTVVASKDKSREGTKSTFTINSAAKFYENLTKTVSV